MINKKKNNKGFTLVELLVVIAIIGILAVVAVPALFKNINKSKVADLESDYSSIKSAVLSYYTDNNKLPSDPGKLVNDMDSVPVKSALGEGQYTFENNTTDKVFYLCVGQKILLNDKIDSQKESNPNGICDSIDNEIQNHECDDKCYKADTKGITITKEQLEKLVADLGDNMVSLHNVNTNKFIDLNKELDFTSLAGEGKVLRLKLINNTDM